MTQMIKVYPIVLTPDTGGYVVFVPDLDINTQGNSLAEALFMARDAIGAWGVCQQDSGRAIPEPSTAEPPHEPEEMISWIDIDFVKYRPVPLSTLPIDSRRLHFASFET